MDLVRTVSSHIIQTKYESLPSEIVETTKRLIMDSVAVAYAGKSAAGLKEIIEIFKDWGGKAESSIWFDGGKLPCACAAQINATMIHAHDFDDTHDNGLIHTGVTTVSTAFAMAEQVGGISGKELITAIALAVELGVRLCLSVRTSMFDSGWHYTTLNGNFSSTAVAGKLLGLDEKELISAFGLAYHQAGGNLQGLHDGVLAKRMGPGFSVRNGITASLMAKKGITGSRNVFQGKDGLFHVYHRDSCDAGILANGLGETFEIVNLSFKPYPCCRENHTAIDAALEIRKQHNVRPEDIASVNIYGGKHMIELLGRPLKSKQNPSSTVEAQFSLPWTVACALLHGSVQLSHFTTDAIKDPAILGVSNKIDAIADSSLDTRDISPARVEILTKEKKSYSHQVDVPYGSPQNPMNFQSLGDKLQACFNAVNGSSEAQKAEKIVECINEFEKLEDANEIVRLMNK